MKFSDLYSGDVSNSAFVAATAWLRDVLLGGIATSVATVAVAALGLLMLSGRVPARRGGWTILGCFVLFSASTIGEGVHLSTSAVAQIEVPVLSPQPIYAPTVPQPSQYDPYAGASVPSRRSAPPIQ